jgi:hypothetical protein
MKHAQIARQGLGVALATLAGTTACDGNPQKQQEATVAQTIDSKSTPAPPPTPQAEPEKSQPAAPPPKIKEHWGPYSQEEWMRAPEVNTQGASTQAEHCDMRTKGDWLRVECTGELLGQELMSNFGKEGEDYFLTIEQGRRALLILKMKKGPQQTIRLCSKGLRASLLVSWPRAKERPVHMALSRGRECDGKNWGSPSESASVTCGSQTCVGDDAVCCATPTKDGKSVDFSCSTKAQCEKAGKGPGKPFAWECTRASDCPDGQGCCGMMAGTCVEDPAECDPGVAVLFCAADKDCEPVNRRWDLRPPKRCKTSLSGPEGTKSCQ